MERLVKELEYALLLRGFQELRHHLHEFADGTLRLRRQNGDVWPLSVRRNLHGAKERRAVGVRPLFENVQRPPADAACRSVHDTQQADVVIRIVEDTEVRDDILDFPPLPETQPADDAVANAGAVERVLKGARLGVGAVHNRDIAKPRGVLVREPLNLARDIQRLVFLVLRRLNSDSASTALFGRKFNFLAFLISTDKRVGGIDYRRRGTVVTTQRNRLRLREIALESEDVLDIGVPPRIDGLIRIADDAEIGALTGNDPSQLVLRPIRVLPLIHHHMVIAALILGQDVGL